MSLKGPRSSLPLGAGHPPEDRPGAGADDPAIAPLPRSSKKLTYEVQKLNDHVEQISSISGAIGLNLSASMLRNLRHLLLNEDQFEKLDPSYCNYKVFQEVLAVAVSKCCHRTCRRRDII
jgi:hypothetical protein